MNDPVLDIDDPATVLANVERLGAALAAHADEVRSTTARFVVQNKPASTLDEDLLAVRDALSERLCACAAAQEQRADRSVAAVRAALAALIAADELNAKAIRM
ncbi:hypothetical protein [Nocardia sp. NPDC051832]|uniref:hypothetical protein n=1 Tax=Nocardia sp. NPDC051832 TaxID=3155673 RepID=UPI0034490553